MPRSDPIDGGTGWVLGALGGGGSILAVPALVYAAGQDPRAATATSLLLVGSAAVVGMVSHLRSGRVLVGTGVVFGLTGVAASIAGSALNRRIDPDLLVLLFGGLVLLAAWRMLVGCPTCTNAGEARALRAQRSGSSVLTRTRVRIDAPRAAQVLVAGSLVGFMTGLFGVGGGFVIVPALTLVLGLSMTEAIGTSLLVIAMNSVSGFAGYAGTVDVPWGFLAAFTGVAVGGILAGTYLVRFVSAAALKRGFALFLLAVGGLMLYQNRGVLTGSASQDVTGQGTALSPGSRR